MMLTTALLRGVKFCFTVSSEGGHERQLSRETPHPVAQITYRPAEITLTAGDIG